MKKCTICGEETNEKIEVCINCCSPLIEIKEKKKEVSKLKVKGKK